MQIRPIGRPHIQFLSVGSGFCLQLPSYKPSQACTCLQLVVSAYFGGTAPTEDFHLLDSAHAGRTSSRRGPHGPNLSHHPACGSALGGSMSRHYQQRLSPKSASNLISCSSSNWRTRYSYASSSSSLAFLLWCQYPYLASKSSSL